jgi:hypothetical protein
MPWFTARRRLLFNDAYPWHCPAEGAVNNEIEYCGVAISSMNDLFLEAPIQTSHRNLQLYRVLLDAGAQRPCFVAGRLKAFVVQAGERQSLEGVSTEASWQILDTIR